MVPRRTSPPRADRTSSAIVPWMLKAKGVPKGKVKLLVDSKEQIRLAWERDSQGTKGFPLNTSYLFLDLESQLMGRKPRKIRSIPYPKVPTRLSDILPEEVVQRVHEYLYEQPFEDALAEVHSADTANASLERLKNTIETALEVRHFGDEALPAPRGNWLHRQLLGIITAVAPEKVTDSEMVELFDHFCPCGIEHNREAIKKFRWRHSRRQIGKPPVG